MTTEGIWDNASDDGEDGTFSQGLAERTIKDPIHDFVPFSAYIWAFIDTRQFQRLRAIKQLGVSYYVWPGASHNRFEHCIGVAHLARNMVEWLKSQQPELGITDRDVRCVQLAGLCHDLGHGPWSHVWDGRFLPIVLPERGWTHEDASEMMFDELVEQNGIQISQRDVNFIKDLIKGVPFHSKGSTPPEKPFLFEIVANKRNGIDVDKFDYIARDSHAIGDKGNISVSRLIRSARVIDSQICYDIKDANQIYELCYTRFSNHKRIYSHKTARAIEFMIIDALIAAEPIMKIAGQIDDPKRYVHLTDDIMARIESTDHPELAESCAIFDRIRTRDLYHCVDYKTFDWDLQGLLKQKVTPKAIVDAAKARFCGSSANAKTVPEILQRSFSQDSDIIDPNPSIVESLTKEHVIVDLVKLHYGMKDKNPLDFIKFYSKRNLNKAAKAESGDFSTLMPSCFGEVLLRIYTKDKQYFGLVQAGYRGVIESLHLDHSAIPLSPPITEVGATPYTPKVRTKSSLANDNNGVGFEDDDTMGNVDPSPVTTPRAQIKDLTDSLSPPSAFQHSHSGTETRKRPPSSTSGTGTTSARATPFTQNSFTKVPYHFVPQSPTREIKRPLQRIGSGTWSNLGTTGTPKQKSEPKEGSEQFDNGLGSARQLNEKRNGTAFESFVSEDTVLNESEKEGEDVTVTTITSLSTTDAKTQKLEAASGCTSTTTPTVLGNALDITPRRSMRRKREEDCGPASESTNGDVRGAKSVKRKRT